MDLSDNEGLSLFSGMTFSSDSSPQTKEQTHQTEQAKSSSTELAEAGLDFHFNKPSIESKECKIVQYFCVAGFRSNWCILQLEVNIA